MVGYTVTEVDQLVEGDIVKVTFRPGVRHYTWEIVCPYAKVARVSENYIVRVKGFLYRHLGEEDRPIRELEVTYPVTLGDYDIKLFMYTTEERERLEEEGHRLFV